MKCTAPGRNIKGKPNDIAVKICKKTISSRLNFVLLFKFVLLASKNVNQLKIRNS